MTQGPAAQPRTESIFLPTLIFPFPPTVPFYYFYSYKLHGSPRSISTKLDVIRKRASHDAKTPSASPGASKRASPISVGEASTGSSGATDPGNGSDGSTEEQ